MWRSSSHNILLFLFLFFLHNFNCLFLTLIIFGPLKYAVLVMNKETNTSKGCAFVRFRNGDDGIKLLDQYQETNPPAQMVAMYAKGYFSPLFYFIIMIECLNLFQTKKMTTKKELKKETRKYLFLHALWMARLY